MIAFRGLSGFASVAKCTVLTLLCLGIACASVGRAEEDTQQQYTAGDIREVTVEIDGESRAIKMVYVPAEESVDNSGTQDNPESESAATKIQLPFFFGLSELSLEQFDSFAPEAVRDSHQRREEQMAPQPEQQADLKKMQEESDQYYAKMVSLDEAAMVTAFLNASLPKVETGQSRLVQSRFRVPTAEEWRRAASMASAEGEFINPWPRFSELSEKEQGRCQELWASCEGRGRFEGSERQVEWLIRESNGDPGQRLELLTTVLRFLLNGRLLNPEKKNSHSWEVQPEPLVEKIDAAVPNEWGIFGIHRGYPEWVLHAANQTIAMSVWRQLEDGEFSEEEKTQDFFGLNGASSLTVNKSDLTPLQQLFVSHEHPVVSGKVAFSWQDAEENELCVDRSSTVRLVLVDCLADDWLDVVRTALVKHEGEGERSATVGDFQTEVRRLTTGPDQSRFIGIIDVWNAIAAYEAGDREEAGQVLKTTKLFGVQEGKQKLSLDEIANLMQGGGAASPRKKAPDPQSLYFRGIGELMLKDGDGARAEKPVQL